MLDTHTPRAPQPFTEAVVCQPWVESDEGWLRPNGYTVHSSIEACKAFCDSFWKEQRAHFGSSTPAAYTREGGEPFLIAATADVLADLRRLESRDLYGAWGEGNVAPSDGVRSIRPPNSISDEIGAPTLQQRLEVLRDPLVLRAYTTALTDFWQKLRKSPAESGLEKTPFFAHLHQVARLLAEQGFGAEVVAAGYLHDHLEDLPNQWNLARLKAEFGPAVAELVDAVTQQDKSLSWQERQQRYLERLRTASDEAISISTADKISNIGDLVVIMRAGFPCTAVVKRGWRENSAKFHELEEIFAQRAHPALYEQFRDALEQFDKLGPATEDKEKPSLR